MIRAAKKTAAGIYALAALATYGIAAEDYRTAAWARYSTCLAINRSDAEADTEPCRSPWTIDAPVVAIVGAAAWPLWWSWAAVEAVQE